MLNKYYLEKYYLEAVNKHFSLKLFLALGFIFLFSLIDIYIRLDMEIFYLRIVPTAIILISLAIHFLNLKNKWIIYYTYNFLLVNLVLMMYLISINNFEKPAFSSSITGTVLILLIFSYELRTNLIYAFLVYFLPFLAFLYLVVYHPAFDKNKMVLISNLLPMLIVGFIFNYLNSKSRYHDFVNEMQLASEKARVDELLAMTKIQNEELSAQNEKILEQKEFLEDQSLEIFESIEYARRIQATYLPEDKFLSQIFPHHFVINQPKDIVSGDFYWVTSTSDADYIAVIDCTGHGVPGAFLTFVASNFLHKAIYEYHFEKPSQILLFLNTEFYRTFRRNEKISLKVGMDLIICRIGKNRENVSFSGSYHSLIRIRAENTEIFRTDMIEIGASVMQIEFSEKQIDLKKGDMVYLFTDGYADQMGGNRDRRFMMRRLKSVLYDMHTMDCTTQKEKLLQCHEDWKGSMFQTDDILLIGIQF
jgi:serine phosphatase RsbU (regulator of sigma subunit)